MGLVSLWRLDDLWLDPMSLAMRQDQFVTTTSALRRRVSAHLLGDVLDVDSNDELSLPICSCQFLENEKRVLEEAISYNLDTSNHLTRPMAICNRRDVDCAEHLRD